MAPLAAAELLSGSPDNKVVRDARTSVAAAVSTEDAATGAGKKLADGLNKPEVTSRAYEDVKQLATMIIQVRSSFGIISTALTIWDFVGLKDSSGNKVVLGPKWNSLTNKFEDALKASIQVAPMASTTLKTVDDLLGGAESQSADDLLARLQAFMEKVKEEEAKALGMTRKFQDLADEVNLFWYDVRRALEIPIVDAARKAALQGINRRLAELTSQLDSLRTRLAALQTQAMEKVAAGASAALLILLTMCPNAFDAPMQDAFDGTDLEAQFDRIQREKKDIDKQITDTQAQMGSVITEQAALQLAQKILGDPKIAFDFAAAKLQCMTQIWQTVNLDMHALYTSLQLNIAPGRKITRLFLSKLLVTKEVYKRLSWLLERYYEELKHLV